MRFVADTPEDYLAIGLLQKYLTQVFKNEKDTGSALEVATKKFIGTQIEKSYERPGDAVAKANFTEFDTNESDYMLAYIVQAATKRKKIAIEYVDTKGKPSTRILEPYNWRNGQLVAWCHERNAWRQFKLQQIQRVGITEDDFERPEEVDIKPSDARDPELLACMRK